MSRPIYAPARFSLRTALVVMLAVLATETIAQWLIERLTLLSFSWGLGASLLHPGFSSTQVILAKLLSTALVLHWALRYSAENWRATGRLGIRPPYLAVAFAPIVAGVVIFLSEIDNLLRLLGPGWSLHEMEVPSDFDALLGTGWQGPFLAVAVAPITEELVFRGVILRGFLGRWRPAVAIAVSALLFAVMHMNAAQFPVAFILGCVLGWVYVRTRSLGLCIAGHALNNASTYFHDFPFEVTGFNYVPEGVTGAIFHPWWFDALGVAFFVAGLVWIHRRSPAAEPWTVYAPPPPPLREPPRLAGAAAALGHCLPPTAAKTDPSMSSELATLVTALAQRARAASLVLATAPTAKKDAALARLADLIDASHTILLEANARDLASPEAAALTAAARDRLTLNAKRLAQLAASVREVVALPDPVGAVLDDTVRPNGLRIRKLRVPIGVIGIIYEARPNVTIDCAVLCLKSGNASILRGGKECFFTNTALAALISTALADAGLPADAVQLVPTTDRAALQTLLKLDTLIHCIIPRGGESLIRYVAQNSTIPVIKHYKGVCFVYVDAAADLAMAEAITLNAKVQRPSACNAAEQLLVHRSVAEKFLPSVARALLAKNVQLRCDPASLAILQSAALGAPLSSAATSPAAVSAPLSTSPAAATSDPSAPDSALSALDSQLSAATAAPVSPTAATSPAAPASTPSTFNLQLSTAIAPAIAPATASDFTTEFLDYVIAIRVVDSLDAAIAVINRDSSNHSDAIVTADEAAAAQFLAQVDSATVYWNASTRFTDGFEFGYGAEIGISTDRLHARGPMGLPELCTYKFEIVGTGQIRG